MTHRFTKEQGALLVIDIQDRLAAAMPAERLPRLVNRAKAAIEGAKALGLPIAVTEQYPKGLGPTLKELSAALPAFTPVEKVEFNAFLPPVREALKGRTSVLVVGMETHICVFQTVRALNGGGADAVRRDGRGALAQRGGLPGGAGAVPRARRAADDRRGGAVRRRGRARARRSSRRSPTP